MGENFPHCWLATLKGVVSIAERAGWRMRSNRRLREFDGDLPDRVRGWPTSAFRRQSLSAAGATLGLVSRWWSDAALFVFAR